MSGTSLQYVQERASEKEALFFFLQELSTAHGRGSLRHRWLADEDLHPLVIVEGRSDFQRRHTRAGRRLCGGDQLVPESKSDVGAEILQLKEGGAEILDLLLKVGGRDFPGSFGMKQFVEVG